MTNLIGQSLGRYQINDLIGQGGMAVVYKAHDTHLDCDVAVKVIRTDQILPAALERTMKRFEREARDVAKLVHPNIVRVIDYGENDGITFLVMPLVSGGTLSQYLSTHGRMDWKEAARMLIPVADALEHAHSHGIIHRDVKPSNILLTSNNIPMLTDFGVAKVLDEEGTMDLTGTNATVGTPEYMAPEQIVSKTVDHRADIYALGVVYYEMVTGKRPFIGETPMQTLFKHASEPLIRPTKLNPGLPMDVERFLMKALMKKPADRFATMTEMENAFQSLVSGVPLSFDLELSADETMDQLETYDEDLGTVDHWGDHAIQPPLVKSSPTAPPMQPRIYAPPAAAKTNSTLWVILGACAVIGVILFILFSGNGGSSGGTSSASGLSDSGSNSSVSQSVQQDSSSSSAQDVYVAPTETKPTITPTIFACPGMPPSRVKVGDKVKICSKERLILRQEPSTSAADIRRFEPGTEFKIIGGPECADDSTWWKALFKYNDKEYTGWVREGTDPESTYFICVVEE